MSFHINPQSAPPLLRRMWRAARLDPGGGLADFPFFFLNEMVPINKISKLRFVTSCLPLQSWFQFPLFPVTIGRSGAGRRVWAGAPARRRHALL